MTVFAVIWRIRRISSPDPLPQEVRDAEIYQLQCGIYSNIFSCTWNSYRVSRLKVQTTILACLAQVSANYDPKLLSTATNVIQEMDGIYASVLIVKELIAYFGDSFLTNPCRLQNCS
jgi:hypothetical protein